MAYIQSSSWFRTVLFLVLDSVTSDVILVLSLISCDVFLVCHRGFMASFSYWCLLLFVPLVFLASLSWRPMYENSYFLLFTEAYERLSGHEYRVQEGELPDLCSTLNVPVVHASCQFSCSTWWLPFMPVRFKMTHSVYRDCLSLFPVPFISTQQ